MILRLLVLLLLLTGCAGGPAAPDWQANAHAALAAHVSAWFAGRDRVAAQELDTARREVARTGDATQLARVELTACAARLASLETGDCPAFAPLSQDADAGAQAYAAYLAGRWQGLDAQQLPAAQRGVVTTTDALATVQAIEEPLSRLVAAGALLRAGRLPPQGIALAIDTAAQQGWRRPLLAWLGVDRERLAAAGDMSGAAARQRRMDIVSGQQPGR
ncbi:MAG: hypothetical protein Q8M20_00665 [Rhodocyclaceae bacterium]|nr:hypothetical protein [Rhodocyclaceae bacterium]MDZ4215698.1 hypothetical protein [Rhodocyclaceae bacterium]